ncbi:MAG: VOC family protein [Sphingorhabdus sp.]|nr:VOC family protein [Sphingorhabdus sp.]
MSNKQGDFIWYELMTSDADAAQAFYGPLIGWNFSGSGQADMDYRQISIDGDGVGGILTLTPEMLSGGAAPCWAGYISVDDVDASARSIKEAGGTIHREPWDIPGVGRVAFVADGQGVPFYIMAPTPPADNPDATSNAFAATQPMVGHCAWNELATTDPKDAKAFYSQQFGWEQDGDMDMGPMGKYEFLKVGDERGFMLGALMPKPDEMPQSAWTYYFRVPDIDKAVVAINANGGTVTWEPTEIPGGDYSLSAIDPQGANFALVGPRK